MNIAERAPVLSVIIPAYNAAGHIEKALMSIFDGFDWAVETAWATYSFFVAITQVGSPQWTNLLWWVLVAVLVASLRNTEIRRHVSGRRG